MLTERRLLLTDKTKNMCNDKRHTTKCHFSYLLDEFSILQSTHVEFQRLWVKPSQTMQKNLCDGDAALCQITLTTCC